MTSKLTNRDIASTLFQTAKTVSSNDDAEALVRKSVSRGETTKSADGALVAMTGKFTGRSAKDKFVVDDALTHDSVWWDNTGRMSAEHFDTLLKDMLAACEGGEFFHQQLFAGASADNRYAAEIFTPNAWHALFIRNLLITPEAADLPAFDAGVTVLHLPEFLADPARHGSRGETCIALDFTRNIVLICGTRYAGEIKKSVFSLFNFHAPSDDVLPMHCSANIGPNGDATLFFGLSGTGKTTLSTAKERALVGDDEHGWSKSGIFNLEGGCYAKAINLSAETEPEIYQAAKFPGAILENVTVDAQTGLADYADDSKTENTRIAYPLAAIPNRVESGLAEAPRNIVLLAADAFGVLPPLARLNRDQAIYYFLSGYTAKVAGTERGVTEPQATFSACFGAPFMARHPTEYGRLLAERLDETGATCWLLNTGWTGGPYGVGSRMSLPKTRRMLEAALSGELDAAEFRADPFFGIDVPVAIEGIEATVLDPSRAWPDAAAYEKQAAHLVRLFDENFKKFGEGANRLAAGGAPSTKAA